MSFSKFIEGPFLGEIFGNFLSLLNFLPGVDCVVAADCGEELCEERDEKVVGGDDVHEKVVGHLADLKLISDISQALW